MSLLCARASYKFFTHTNLFIPYNKPTGKCCFPNFTNKKTGSERLSDLLKVTQLESKREDSLALEDPILPVLP